MVMNELYKRLKSITSIQTIYHHKTAFHPTNVQCNNAPGAKQLTIFDYPDESI